jgi:hypothetical protein
MRGFNPMRVNLTFMMVLVAAAGAWPIVACAMQRSRAVLNASDAWCGALPQVGFEVLGHCPACWVGAAAIVVAPFLAHGALTPPRAAPNRAQGAP